ncbi:his Kinase A domain protein, partial [Vibrio parahaemolyticus 10296]
SR